MFLQAADLGGQLRQLQGVAYPDQQPLRPDGLDEEVLRPGLHGLDHGFDAAIGGQDDDRNGHARRADFRQRLQTRQARHDEV
ncbi:hypothetical protein D3C80_1767350 [compost metagenome]